jgi:hypothetical protein
MFAKLVGRYKRWRQQRRFVRELISGAREIDAAENARQSWAGLLAAEDPGGSSNSGAEEEETLSERMPLPAPAPEAISNAAEFVALWTPTWYAMDQKIARTEHKTLHFFTSVPEHVRSRLVHFSGEEYAAVFSSGSRKDRGWYELDGEIVSIENSELGEIASVRPAGFDYVVTLASGDEILVDAEENPGTIHGSERMISDWTMRIVVRPARDARHKLEDRVRLFIARKFEREPAQIPRDWDLVSYLRIYGNSVRDLVEQFGGEFQVDVTGFRWFYHTGPPGCLPRWLFRNRWWLQAPDVPIRLTDLVKSAETHTWAITYPTRRDRKPNDRV